MRIAVLGGGFAGLATAWHLLAQKRNIHVTLFDPAAIGGQASAVSAGLLHTYIGLHAKYNQYGREGYLETERLLQVAERALGLPVCARSGLLRPALNEGQMLDYRLCAEKNEDTEWLSVEQAQQKVQGLIESPALWIKSALTIYPDLYLEGLWMACQQLGLKREARAISDLSELSGYDAVILATGPQSLSFPELQETRLSLIKGQILELKWPESLSPLPLPINSQAYIVMNRDNKSCIIGSTYERTFTSCEPDADHALNEILPKAAALIPALAGAQVLGCRAGIRVSAPDHLPMIKQVAHRTWLFTGLGSKGLLYHALYAKKIVQEIINQL